LTSARPISIHFVRLPGEPAETGLILLSVETGSAEGRTRLGSLTEAGLRGRLAHYDLHSANEIASIRHALAAHDGTACIEETWSSLDSCLQFWHSFFGSQIRPLEWACDTCGTAHREEVGGSVGETFSLRCDCGRLNQLTLPRSAPRTGGAAARSLPRR
jgi:hypothetical protein